MSTIVNNSCYKDIQTLEGHASAFESNTPSSKRIEYILEWNLLEKSVKRPFSCFVFILAGVLHIFVLCNLLGPRTSFYRKSQINIERKPNYEIDWFHY